MTHASLSRVVRIGAREAVGVASLLGPVGAAAVSAALAAAAMRPWGLGALALVAYVPAFSVLATMRSAVTGAVVAAVASLGAVSVGYEATAAIGPLVYALALTLAPLPFAAAGALAVRFGRALRSRRAAEGDSVGVGERAAAGERAGVGQRGAAGVRGEPHRRPSSLAVLAALPVLWCAAEWLPAQPWLWGVVAMPLGAIGYSQVDLPTLQLAALSSVTSVSIAVLAVNALLVIVVRGRSPTLRLTAATGIAGVAVVVALAHQGSATLAPSSTFAPSSSGSELVVRLVQPNLPDSAYLAAAALPAARRALADHLTSLASNADPSRPPADLTILPEAAWPGPLRLDDARASLPLPSGLQPLLFGAPSSGSSLGRSSGAGLGSGAGTGTAVDTITVQEGESRAQRADWYANSAFLLADDTLARVQDKMHLVPMAESGLRSGSGPAVFEAAGLPLSVLICYDVVFPATARAAARSGAAALVVLTDDSFAAKGDVPVLHLRVARFRAVETGLPLVLAANTGPSGIVSARGRVVAQTPELVATTLTAAVPLSRRSTPYLLTGDWLGPLATVGAVAIAVLALSRGGGAGSFGSRPT